MSAQTKKKNLQKKPGSPEALRSCARQTIGVWMLTAILLTFAFCLMAVLAGSRWLPGAGILLAIVFLLDLLIAVTARSKYHMLMSQAHCAEVSVSVGKSMADEEWRRRMMLEKMAHSHPEMIGEVGLEELQRYSDMEAQSSGKTRHRRRTGSLEVLSGKEL